MKRGKAIEIVKSAFSAWESEFRVPNDDWSEEHEALDMAIEALQSTMSQERVNHESTNDLISRADVIDALCNAQCELDVPHYPQCDQIKWCDEVKALLALPSAETKWIPVKWHEITEEERGLEGYPKDWVVHIDCEMPCDGDEILVQTKSGYIRWDVCYEDDGIYLDSGWDWVDDIVAWMPLPQPYEGSESDEID